MKNDNPTASKIPASVRTAAICAITLGFGVMPASAANLTRSIEVSGAPSDGVVRHRLVLRHQGLAAAGRHVHRRRQDRRQPGRSSPRTARLRSWRRRPRVTTKEYSYSYAFLSSPLPVTQYKSTIKVTAKGEGVSVVTWTGSYTPDSGKEKDAIDALNGVYESGLAAIQARFKK